MLTEPVPAVSGSSGRLLVSKPRVPKEEQSCPGRVFEEEGLTYIEAMDQFVAIRQAERAQEGHVDETSRQDTDDQKRQRLALRSDMQRLQVARREEREKRRLEDRAWKALQRAHRKALSALKGMEGGSRSVLGKKREAIKAKWRAQWAERHKELAQRREEDARWREERTRLREREQAAGVVQVMTWIAILVIVDNCTRRCLGLPLFTMGAHVTAEQVVEALKALLPKALHYLIADGGTHFTADVMKELAKARGFVRVPLARHRAQSNGVAERFIETLKGWLAAKAWQTPAELEALLAEFLTYYNDRPHQGRELAGLSPNEYAARLRARILNGDTVVAAVSGTRAEASRDATGGGRLCLEDQNPCLIAV